MNCTANRQRQNSAFHTYSYNTVSWTWRGTCTCIHHVRQRTAAAISHRRQTSFAIRPSTKSVYWSILLFPHNTVVRQTDGRTDNARYHRLTARHIVCNASCAVKQRVSVVLARGRLLFASFTVGSVMHCGMFELRTSTWIFWNFDALCCSSLFSSN